MGIVNVTPDSFSDGGRFLDHAAAVAHGLALLDEGADWLDVGGESTRPGAPEVGAEEELARVVPVIRGLHEARPDVTISIDTAKEAVAAGAIAAGARVVNDVSALADDGMGEICAAAGVQVVLMHMRGTPRTMHLHTTYDDVVGDVTSWLAERVERALLAGIARDRILVDPGVGFAKTSADNAVLIAGIPTLKALGQRVVIGASRKRFIGDLTGVSEPARRVHGSVGAALAAAAAGADVLRVHDVAATAQALTVWGAIRDAAERVTPAR